MVISHKRPRGGFTLIELLVVIALIATLIALTAGAFFRVRAGQIKSASEATLQKLNTALDNRMRAIQESVNEDAKKNQGQWQNALATAGGNTDVAKSLLLYAKVKNELPMTFAEAKAPTVVGGIVLPARANYAALPISTANYEEQSAVCFYLAVMTSAGGGAMTDGDGLNQQTMDAPTFSGQKVFKDAWGTPVAFARHAYVAPELDQPPFVKNAAAGTKDSFDPTPNGRLGVFLSTNAPIWNGILANTAGSPGSANIPGAYLGNRNHVATLVSAGPNKNFGANALATTDNDNLLSYRLRREGAKGD